MTPIMQQLMDKLQKELMGHLETAVADSLDVIAESYANEPEANYNGMEVAHGLRGYATTLREDAETLNPEATIS